MTILKQPSKNVIDQSMTVLHYSWVITENCHWLVNDNFEAAFQKCHWPVNDSFALQLGYHRKLSLTSQWQFWSSHLKMSLTSQWLFRITVGLSQKIVIHQSMTIFNSNFKIVIDRSMTIFNSHFKIVIDRSMTVSHYSWVITENCHWLVNDNFEAAF